MSAPTIARTRAADLHDQLSPAVLDQARKHKMSLSSWLEREDPSDGYTDGLDAFGRQLKIAGIRVKPAGGQLADELSAFEQTPQSRLLLAEWMMRRYRSAASSGAPQRERALLSSDTVVGSTMRPYVDSALDHSRRIAPAIPLASLIATNTAIEGDTYRAWYINDVAGDQRLVRVGETAAFPRTTVTTGERTITIYKFGRALEISYEALRRQRIDRVGVLLARMAVQAEVDKVAAVLDVLVNGDGNSGTAATNVLAKTDLDAAATGKALTLKAWLLYKMKFQNPYMLTTALARSGDAYKMLTLNIGSANIPLVTISAAAGFGGFQQINNGLADNVRVGWTDDAPADTIVGFDARFAIERVYEQNANLAEIERWALRQVQALVISEVEGYAKLDPQAVYTLTLEA